MTAIYNYLKAMINDITEYISENINLEEYTDNIGELNTEALEDHLNDELWIADSVTGNASGSYYCNRCKARKALAGNEDLLIEAIEEFGDDPESYKRALREPEYADVTIRCYLLGRAIAEAIENIEFKTEV